MKFCSLHHHSTYSYQDGYGQPSSHVSRAAELGMPALALTEHGNVSSHVPLEKAAKKSGIKPIFGCELYAGIVGSGATQRKNHLTVVAENEIGYRNLLRVVSEGWAKGFYYEPTVSGQMLRENKDGLVILSGCSGSLLATTLVGGKNVAEEDASFDEAVRVAARFKNTFGSNFYIEVQAFPELDKVRQINEGLVLISKKLHIPLVATLDCHYTRPDENEMQIILHSMRSGGKVSAEEQAQSWGYDVPLTFQDDATITDRLIGTGLNRKQAHEAIINAAEIAARCNVTLPKVENLRYPLPPNFSDGASLFRRWVNDGWIYRNIPARSDRKAYRERLKIEMEAIESKGFADYFLVVSDAVKWAKDHGIPVGPARGSAAASLVCYLLRITEVDPMRFPSMMFERFIDVNRKDLPDIDLDFDDERRWEVKAYLVSKYGEERVGNIGNFVHYRGRNSIDDVGRVHRVPKDRVEFVKEMLLDRSEGDERFENTIEDTVALFPSVREVFDAWPILWKAAQFEGNVKNMSVHSAGLVIANSPLSDFCAVYTRKDAKTGETLSVVSLDKNDAEYLNVMKLDQLGLKTLAAIRIALEHIGMTLEELYAMPLDDEETMRGFRENDTVGIFQFDGRTMRAVNADVVPDTFQDLCHINALVRPGSLHSGATAAYVEIKHGRKKPERFHPIMDKITEWTQYQIVYQEQILQIVRQLGNFSWDDTGAIRKLISKSQGEQAVRRYRELFASGAQTHGLSIEEANRIFDAIAKAGAYAFNVPHCVSYGMLAYWTMYLKRKHPLAFYLGMLRKFGTEGKDDDRRDDLLRDMKRNGRYIPVETFNINLCERSWTASKEFGTVMPGLEQIPGIAEKTATKILNYRASRGGRFKSVDDMLEVPGIGPSKVALIDQFSGDDDPFGLNVLTEKLEKIKTDLRNGVDDGSGVFCLPAPSHRSDEMPGRTPRDVGVAWLGLIKNRIIRDIFETHYKKTGQSLDYDTVRDSHLRESCILIGQDDGGELMLIIDRWKYPRLKELIWNIEIESDVVLVSGVKRANDARRGVIVKDIWILGE